MTPAGGRALLLICCGVVLPSTGFAGGKGETMNDFVFTYRATGGPEIADGLAERESLLRVDGRRTVATYEQHRSVSERNGEPIGRFEVTVDPAVLLQLRAVLDTGILDQLSPTSGGSFSSALLTYGFEARGKRVEKVVSSGDHDQISRLGPLSGALNPIRVALFQHPRAALRLDLRHIAGADGERFELVLVNIGTEPIEVANPRRLTGRPGSAAFAEVAVVPPEEPGVTPLPPDWTTKLHLERAPAGAKEPPRIRLAPGAASAFRTEPWHHGPNPGMEYLIQAMFESYAATPANPGGASAYLVRGAARSSVLVLPATPR